MSKKDFVFVLIIVVLVAVVLQKPKETIKREITTRTEVVRDTIRDSVPVPVNVYRYRVDTVLLSIATGELIRSIADSLNQSRQPDSLQINIPLPIERKEYITENYRAIVEGYKPHLVTLDIYSKTYYTTHTDVTTIRKNYRFGVGLQTGYGFNGKEIKPYIGIGIHYNLFRF